MAWDHLSINKPHLVYIVLGGFTTLFMLCSSFIKERLYIGEATVATICGIIFGPHAANLIDPGTWGNTDQITLEFSRIVLVVQCFAVGVELPKAYMERHWRSIVFLLVPVMTFGWLITSLFIWGVFSPSANWLDSLCIAACVTATDPVLASSVVGKGKFAKRVPKHLRDLLSAESGCNDGMAFPFIYLALYVIKYKNKPDEVALNWICITILYECVFGAVYGVLVGYIARRLIRYAHERDLIDRESFLVFYFVLALFCAGSGSILGIDDLLVGFACGVGFSNDGWFTEKTEESHVSNVIDLLINLAFFVYFGTIIPWAQYNNSYLQLDVWRLVVIAFLVLFFRRIPIMLLLKPLVPDIKTWREALFAGHFGPIGVGALFVAIMARAELETDSTTPLATLPPADFPEDNIIVLIWPITTFLVITSIVVHGSSIAVFTLGKHINTLTLTMSYTQANEQGPSWMDRLPRIQSRSKSSMRSDSSFEDKEKTGLPADIASPTSTPALFLRRQREEDTPAHSASRSSSRQRHRRSKSWDIKRGAGGPVSQSAIAPQPREVTSPTHSKSNDSTTPEKSEEPAPNVGEGTPERASDGLRDENFSPGEIYEEGHNTVYEDEEGEVLAVEPTQEGGNQASREKHERDEGRHLMHEEAEHARDKSGAARQEPSDAPGDVFAKEFSTTRKTKDHEPAQPNESVPERPGKRWRDGMSKVSTMRSFMRPTAHKTAEGQSVEKKAHGPARAYQYGNTVIVEDEDGEVIKKYDIPSSGRKQPNRPQRQRTHQHMEQIGKMLTRSQKEPKAVKAGPSDQPSSAVDAPQASGPTAQKAPVRDDEDHTLRFTIASGGRRMSTAEFLDEIRQMDPRKRVQTVEDSDVPEAVKQEARQDARERAAMKRSNTASSELPVVSEHPRDNSTAEIHPVQSRDSHDLKLVTSEDQEVPLHDVSMDLRRHRETAAERRRRQVTQQPSPEEDSEDDGTDRVPPRPDQAPSREERLMSDGTETAAERRRREGALGIRHGDESDDSDENDQPREVPRRQGIRFADAEPTRQQRQSTVRWGRNTGR